MKDNDDNINYFCALDWATQKHYYVLQDKTGETLSEGYFPNSNEGYEEFLAILRDHAEGQRIALILEAIRGAPMNMLIGIKWLKLCPVNPIKTKKLSELEGVSGGKSDPRDTRLLCDYLRMSYRKLSKIYVEEDSQMRILRELVGLEKSLVQRVTKLKQRIWGETNTLCPQLEDLLGDIESPVYQQYLLKFNPLKPAKDTTIANLLRKYKLYNPTVVTRFIEAHKKLKPLGKDKAFIQMQLENLRSWVRQLITATEELRACEKRMDAVFKQMPQAAIYLSMPSVGPRLAPRLASMFGSEPSQKYHCKAQVRAYFGQVPITFKSGKHTLVLKRHSCDRSSRQTCFLWARSTNMAAGTSWQKDFLHKHKEKGDRVPTRYRKLGAKLTGILYKCLCDNTLYDPAIYQKNIHQNA